MNSCGEGACSFVTLIHTLVLASQLPPFGCVCDASSVGPSAICTLFDAASSAIVASAVPLPVESAATAPDGRASAVARRKPNMS